MKIYLKNNLLFTNIDILYNGKIFKVNNVIIDTGSSHCIIEPSIIEDSIPFNSDVELFYGVNNVYTYIKRKADAIIFGGKSIKDIDIYFGSIDEYINGILGLDFLIRAGISLDFNSFKNNIAVFN